MRTDGAKTIDGERSFTGVPEAAGRVVSGTMMALALCAGLFALAWIGAEPAWARDRESVVVSATFPASSDSFVARFEFDGDPAAELVTLENPARIALDLHHTLSAVSTLPALSDAGPVKGVRHGLVTNDRYRIIFRLAGPVSPRLEREALGAQRTRLTLTLRSGQGASGTEIAGRSGAGAAGNESLPRRPTVGPRTADGPDAVASRAEGQAGQGGHEGSPAVKPLTIVLDPGHGGPDLGAVSESGVEEKVVNLALARAMRDVLSRAPSLEVILTRDDDTIVSLADRWRLASERRADLFVSIHADSIRYPELRGATVYTLSDDASDALSRRIAQSENAADRYVPDDAERTEPDISGILTDLTRRETVGFSEHIAGALVSDLGEAGIRLIKRPKRSANFVVLKAPDVPSILLEAGFLSNSEDAELLSDPEWRRELAHEVAEAILTFFRGEGATDGLADTDTDAESADAESAEADDDGELAGSSSTVTSAQTRPASGAEL